MPTKSQKKEHGKSQSYTCHQVVNITDETLEARQQMLLISDEDIKAGRLISQQSADKRDLKWLKNFTFDQAN